MAAPVADPRVRDAVRRLDELSDLPPAEHVEVYEAVHSSLQESLAEASRQADESSSDGSRTFVSRRARLDAELVRRGLARSREHAADAGRGRAGDGAGTTTVKPATQVDAGEADRGRRRTRARRYVSRGGHKLAGALDVFEPRGLLVAGRRASTPARPPVASPTCCCVAAPRRSSASTSATASSPGRCRPTTGSRSATAPTSAALEDAPLDPPVDLVVADLSFISLRLVLPALVRSSTPDADLLLDGQAAVRGGSRTARRRRCRPRARRCGRPRSARSPRRRTPTMAWVSWG